MGGIGMVALSGVGALIVTGNITGPTNTSGNATAGAIVVSGSGTLTTTGQVIGGSSSNVNATSHAILITAAAATVTVNASLVIGGASNPGNSLQAGNSSAAINNYSSSTLTVNGPCQAGSGGPAIAAGFYTQITRLSGPLLLGLVGNINPVLALAWRWAPTQIPTSYEVPPAVGTTKRLLYTADNIPTANYPTQGNVRSGTAYGPNLENTGTLAVPAPGSVALGVATDNTTGTAVLTSANVQTALGAFSSGRLNNVATVDSTGAQIQAAVSA